MFGLALFLLGGCASVPQVADDTQTYPTFIAGNATLNCTWTCSGTYGASRQKLKELYVNEDWRKLAALVMQIGHGVDQAYFYLGRAAEGLGANEAALKYYRAALVQEAGGGLHCNYLFNNCDGFDFPAEINARIDAIKAATAKANAPAAAPATPAAAAPASRAAPSRIAPASNTECGVVTNVPFTLGFKANSAGKIQANKIFKSGPVPVLLENGTSIQVWATRAQAEQAAKDGGHSKANLKLVKGKWRIVSFSAECAPAATTGAQLPFKQAVDDGLASVTIEALNGGAQLNLTFESLTDKPVMLVVPAGNSTIESFYSNITFTSPKVQKIPLAPHASATVVVDQPQPVLTRGSMTIKVIKSTGASAQPPAAEAGESTAPETAPKDKTPDEAQVNGDLGAGSLDAPDSQAEITARIEGRKKLAEQLGAMKPDEALIVFAIRTPEKGTAGRYQFSQVGLAPGGPVIQSGDMMAKLTGLGSEIPYLGTMRTKQGAFQQVYFIVMKATSQRIFGLSTLGSGTPRPGDWAMFNGGVGFIVIPAAQEVCYVKTFVFKYAEKPTMLWLADPEVGAWLHRRFGDISPLVAAMKPCGQMK